MLTESPPSIATLDAPEAPPAPLLAALDQHRAQVAALLEAARALEQADHHWQALAQEWSRPRPAPASALNGVHADPAELARLKSALEAAEDHADRLQSRLDEAQAQAEAKIMTAEVPITGTDPGRLATLERENAELREQAEAMFAAMDKRSRGSWLERDATVRDLVARRDELEAKLRALIDERAVPAAAVVPAPDSFRTRLAELERERDEALSQRDAATAQADEFFQTLDVGDRNQWLDRGDFQRQMDELRHSYEEKVLELRRELDHRGNDENHATGPLRAELARVAQERDDAVLQRDEALNKAEELFSTLDIDSQGLKLELDATRRELDEAKAQAKTKAEPDAVGPLRAELAQAQVALAERSRRIQAVEAENQALAQRLAEPPKPTLDPAELERLREQLRDEAAERVRLGEQVALLSTALEQRESTVAPPDAAELEHLAAALDQAEAKILALEARPEIDPSENAELRSFVAELIERHDQSQQLIVELQQQNEELADALEQALDAPVPDPVAALQLAPESGDQLVAPEGLSAEMEQLYQDLKDRQEILDELQARLEEAERREGPDPEAVADLQAKLEDAERVAAEHRDQARRLLAERDELTRALGERRDDEGDAAALRERVEELESVEREAEALRRELEAQERQWDEVAVELRAAQAAADQVEELQAQLEAMQASFAELSGGEVAAVGDPAEVARLKAEVADLTGRERRLAAEVDRMCQQVAEGAGRQQEIARLRQLVAELTERESYIEELEQKLAGWEDAPPPALPPAVPAEDAEEIAALRDQNLELQAQLDQLTREMESVADLPNALRDLEASRARLLHMQEEHDATIAQVQTLEAELERARQERDAEVQELRVEAAKLKAERARERLDVGLTAAPRSSGRSGAPGGTGPGRGDSGETEAAQQASVDERIRAFRQHLDTIEQGKPKSRVIGFLGRFFGER